VTDTHAKEFALRAEGLLADFNRAGVIGVADVHVSQRMGAILAESDESVLLALALTVGAARSGSVCLDLATVAVEQAQPEAEDESPVELAWPAAEEWVQRVARSPLATAR
jgi:exodeoxyribonuclease V alpha subunit